MDSGHRVKNHRLIADSFSQVNHPGSRRRGVRSVGRWEHVTMPLIHVSLRAGKPEAYRQAILDGLYRAMRETLDVPEDDQFMTISEHDAANFRTGNGYGISRS